MELSNYISHAINQGSPLSYRERHQPRRLINPYEFKNKLTDLIKLNSDKGIYYLYALQVKYNSISSSIDAEIIKLCQIQNAMVIIINYVYLIRAILKNIKKIHVARDSFFICKKMTTHLIWEVKKKRLPIVSVSISVANITTENDFSGRV